MTILPQRNDRRAKEGTRNGREHRAINVSSNARVPPIDRTVNPNVYQQFPMQRYASYGRASASPAFHRQHAEQMLPQANVAPTSKRMRSFVTQHVAQTSMHTPHLEKVPQTATLNIPPKTQECNSDDEETSARIIDTARLDTQSYDEASTSQDAQKTITVEELENGFEQLMNRKGFQIKPMKGDGACLFRAVADQLYGDEEMHAQVRHLCMNYIADNRDHFADFIANENFDDYVARKRRDDVHGNHVEIQAIAEMFNRPVHVYEYSDVPKNIYESASAGNDNPPLRLTYHCASHYNSLIDPNKPTCGVGLGMPELKPGLADQLQMRDAVRLSEATALEEQMLADKMAATDWQATEDHIAAEVAHKSYVEWLEQKKAPHRRSPTREQSTSSKRATPPPVTVPSVTRVNSSPNRLGTTDLSLDTASSTSTAAPLVEDDDLLLAEVLALSQQEYYDSMSQASVQPKSLDTPSDKPSTSRDPK